MNVKNWIPLGAALLLGVITLVIAGKALNKSKGEQSKATLATMAVAARDLPAGHVIKPEDVTELKVAPEAMMSGSYRTGKELEGRTTTLPLRKGDPVLEALLAPAGSGGGLPALIPDGYRAMTLEVNQFTGVAGMIQPGSRVDIISVLRDEKGGQPTARTILQNIEVRAVGRNVNPAPSDPNVPPPPPSDNVTLLLTPDDAQALQLASQSSRPWLVMRGGRDRKTVETAVTTLASLRGDAQGNGDDGHGSIIPTSSNPTPASTSGDPFAPRNGMAAARVVQVIRGGVESTVTFHDKTAAPHRSPATRPVTTPPPADPPRILTGAGSEAMKPE